MAKIEDFKIVLNKQKPCYFAGDSLTGHVYITVKQQLQVNLINLRIIGECRWSSERSELYLDQPISLDPIKEQSCLPSEITSYPFEFHLPKDLPSSFQHDFVKIHYYIRGSVDVPMTIENRTEKVNISIVKHLNLNQEKDSLTKSIKVNSSKSGSKLRCKLDTFNIDLSLMKSGFVPGESIEFIAQIDNQSNKPLRFLSIHLIETAVFYTKGSVKPQIADRLVAFTTHSEYILPRQSFTWDGSLFIPPTCPTSEKNTSDQSTYVKIGYRVVLYCDRVKKGVLATPVTIGTVPLENDVADQLDKEIRLVFERCINEEDCGDDIDFLPFYPYYQFVTKY